MIKSSFKTFFLYDCQLIFKNGFKIIQVCLWALKLSQGSAFFKSIKISEFGIELISFFLSWDSCLIQFEIAQFCSYYTYMYH